MEANRLHSSFNTLAPGRFVMSEINFKLISVIDGSLYYSAIAPIKWLSLDLTGDYLTSVSVVALCCQKTSHYLRYSWHTYMSSYGATRSKGPKSAIANLLQSTFSVTVIYSYSWCIVLVLYWDFIIYAIFQYHDVSRISEVCLYYFYPNS